MSTKVSTLSSVVNTTFSTKPDTATSEEINSWNMHSDEEGTIVYNSTTKTLNIFNGAEWSAASADASSESSITVVNNSEATSGQEWAVKGTTYSTLDGAFSYGTYGQSIHEGDVRGKYNYGAYNKGDGRGTNGYAGVIYGSYNEGTWGGSDPNDNNATWSSVYGVQSKAKITGSGDLGYVIGNNVSSELSSSAADVEWLQGQHITVKHTAGNVSGNIAVTLLDYDGGSGTVDGDFAYLQIQADSNASSGVSGVTGESRAINSDSALASSFNGEIWAEGFKVNTIQTAPLTSTSTGVAGTVIVASDAIYVCTATDVWVKSALTTF